MSRIVSKWEPRRESRVGRQRHMEPAHMSKFISISRRPHMEEKNATLGWQQAHRKVGIRPFNVGQWARACMTGTQVHLWTSALNGRMPTLRFSLIVGNACGVFFFQGGVLSRAPHSSRGQDVGNRMPQTQHAHTHGGELFSGMLPCQMCGQHVTFPQVCCLMWRFFLPCAAAI